jgi:hypothetical protein
MGDLVILYGGTLRAIGIVLGLAAVVLTGLGAAAPAPNVPSQASAPGMTAAATAIAGRAAAGAEAPTASASATSSALPAAITTTGGLPPTSEVSPASSAGPGRLPAYAGDQPAPAPLAEVGIGGCPVPPHLAEDPYGSRAWRACFWQHPHDVAEAMPERLRPHREVNDVNMLAAGVVLSTLGAAGLLNSVALMARFANSNDDGDDQDHGSMKAPVAAGLIAAPIGAVVLGVGLALTLVGGHRPWVDPEGNRIPKRGEARAQQEPVLHMRLGVGTAGIDGTF